MSPINYLASFLEALKLKSPIAFALVQIVFFGIVAVLEVNPSDVLDWISYNFPNMNPVETVDSVQLGLTALGFSMSTGTTKYLSPNHKKIKAIEAEKEKLKNEFIKPAT